MIKTTKKHYFYLLNALLLVNSNLVIASSFTVTETSNFLFSNVTSSAKSSPALQNSFDHIMTSTSDKKNAYDYLSKQLPNFDPKLLFYPASPATNSTLMLSKSRRDSVSLYFGNHTPISDISQGNFSNFMMEPSNRIGAFRDRELDLGTPNPIPLPPSIWLFGSAILGFLMLRKKVYLT